MIDGNFEDVVKERNDLLLRLAAAEERAEKAEDGFRELGDRLQEWVDECSKAEAERDRLREEVEDAVELLEWTEDDDWWCEPGFRERRDAWLGRQQHGKAT